MSKAIIISDAVAINKIHIIRGEQVMLDSDLAELYGVETKYLRLPLFGICNHEQRPRPSAATVDADGDTKYEHATHYSYDIHACPSETKCRRGNVAKLAQDNPDMSIINNQYKIINYQAGFMCNSNISCMFVEIKTHPMIATQIRHRLYEYIRFADEKKVKAIYTIVEEEIKEKQEVWNKAFVKEMQQRAKEIESGKVQGKNRAPAPATASSHF